MKSLIEIGAGCDTDKSPELLARYSALLDPLRDQPVRLLELGVLRGGSLRMWAEYFWRGEIFGVDQTPVVVDHPRIHVIQGDQRDAEVPGTFDVVIDDASHIGEYSAASLRHFWPQLRPGGLYCIEDWATGYWPDWPDGQPWRPGHSAGMVGFIKSLVDHTSQADMLRGGRGGPAEEITELRVWSGFAVARRA